MTMRWRLVVRAALALAVSALATTARSAPNEPNHLGCAPSGRTVIGWVERVRLPGPGIEEEARIDTGAETSSIDARILRIARTPDRPDQERAVFEIEDGKGGTAILERGLVGWIRVKNKGSRGSTRRPVIQLSLCLAGKRLTGRVNLADRRGFDYPILIGRDLLAQGRLLVDSSLRFTHSPVCGE